MNNEVIWQQTDIRQWYAYHDGKCPNCGLDMKSCHPLYNIYPHWTGACKEAALKGKT